MKLKLTISLLGLFLALPSIVRADHTGHAGVAQLHSDAHRLEYTVQSSWLRQNVKYSVYTFAAEASAFYDCVARQPNGSNGSNDHTQPSCEYNEQRVRQAWYPVQRYLYDTYYDFPQVYQAYQQVSYDIQQLN